MRAHPSPSWRPCRDTQAGHDPPASPVRSWPLSASPGQPLKPDSRTISPTPEKHLDRGRGPALLCEYNREAHRPDDGHDGTATTNQAPPRGPRRAARHRVQVGRGSNLGTSSKGGRRWAASLDRYPVRPERHGRGSSARRGETSDRSETWEAPWHSPRGARRERDTAPGLTALVSRPLMSPGR